MRPPVVAQRGAGSRVGRERPLDQPRHGHDVPLQPLGRVHGHHLHGVGAGLDPAEVEPALLVDRGIEPREEPAERGPVRGRGEGGRDVGEGVEVGPRRAGGPPGPGQHLDVEAEGHLRLGGQLGQPQPGERAQPAHRPAEAREPLEGDRPDRLALVTGPGRGWQVVERLDDARAVARVGCEVGAPATPGALPGPGPGAEPVEVCGAEPAGRPGEQSHQPVAPGGVLHDPEQRDEVGHLGRVQEPAEADDLVGDAARLECLDHRVELGSLAAQHRCGASARAGAAVLTQAATCAASSSIVARRAVATCPRPASARAASEATRTRVDRVRGSATRLATSSTARSLRQLVDSGTTSGGRGRRSPRGSGAGWSSWHRASRRSTGAGRRRR